MSNNQIAVQDDDHTELSVMPPRLPVQAVARQVLMDHAELASMAYDFATKLVGTKMVPLRFRGQAEEATAAILYGAEIGLGPISALQNIFEVHGSPGIYARTAQALLEAKGFQFKTTEHTNAACTVQGWKPNHNPEVDDPDEESRFTYDDAERAGWAPQVSELDKGGKVIRGVRYETNVNGKLIGNEKYLSQPRQMLWAKAMMEVCRHLSPATLLGIAYSVEELESEHESHNPIGGGGSSAPAAEPLTVDEILDAPDNAAATVTIKAQPAPAQPEPIQDAEPVEPDTVEPDTDPEPEPVKAPAKGKRASKREQAAAKAGAAAGAEMGKAMGTQIPGKPKGHTDRVEAALAKAAAAQHRDADTQTPETTPAAEPEPQTGPVETPERDDDDVSTPDPSETEPTGDALDYDQASWDELPPDPEPEPVDAAAEQRKQDALADLRAQVDAERTAKPAAPLAGDEDPNWDGLKPATRDQLQQLAECIAAAGWQPTPEGRETWFAWLSQEVGRDVTANNQLSRREILGVIKSMRAEQG